MSSSASPSLSRAMAGSSLAGTSFGTIMIARQGKSAKMSPR